MNMIIQKIETFQTHVPLIKPFKTALRTVTAAEAIIVKITCEDGRIGWGEAPPTAVITGETLQSIEGAIHYHLKPALLKGDLLNQEEIFHRIQACMTGNGSAKAAVDMAIYDLVAQRSGLPLYQFLGGYKNRLETDFTVSVNEPSEMADDARQYIREGFDVLKVKVGKDDIEKDIRRIQAIREAIGRHVQIRLDANQGWGAKEAARAIKKMEDSDLGIELIEQPVPAHDLNGLKWVTDQVDTPIMADESVFSPLQALEVIKNRCADLINIKLMKAGGIHQAIKINVLAEAAGMECMVGSMIESRLGITAAAHFAASSRNITRYDFDAPLMLAHDFLEGGVTYEGKQIRLSENLGLGIKHIHLEKGRITNDGKVSS